MPLPQFSEVRNDDRLGDDQRAFLDRLGDLLTAEKPSLVPLDSVTARVIGKRKAKAFVDVTIPNQGDPDLELGLAVEPGAVVVGYGWGGHHYFRVGRAARPA